ncbi:transglycosylase SLT domain-containing protein [Streptomyces sp. H39-S7]|uniref:transglycosylase SLT domain-containing protein n=1 Tax=Streptomyces sp. H39-S7 TaxID=3004357 RepID=UPI0022AE9968|nr:transglycosylase SLT domain-containing protein [Streptomyces sp. H39-S7]MCZ4119038.1 transglycosylase SLT domain-containing protein [Streptomyces sp. H39-S7]
MATTGRAPIKVGSGYIEINTQLSKESLAKFRTDITKQMEKTGSEAGKAFSASVEKGLSTLPGAVATIARKTKENLEAASQDSAETIAKIEANLTKQFGAEAAKRFQEARKLEEEKQALASETSSVTMKALQTTVAQESAAAAARSKATVTAERAMQAAARETATAQAQAAREAAAQQQAAIRETAAARLTAQKRFLQDQIEQQVAVRASLRAQLAEANATAAGITAVQTTAFRRLGANADKSLTEVGTRMTETGALITSKITLPMTIAAGLFTSFGIKSADSMIQAQKSLESIGLTIKDTTKLLKEMTQYGIQTPYSVQDVITAGTRVTRSVASHDPGINSKNPKVKAAASSRVSTKSQQITQMIGDLAAFGGITDPTIVNNGYRAIELLMEQGRVNTRNVRQLTQSTNLPTQELANLLGFEDTPYTKKEIEELKKNGRKDPPKVNQASSQLLTFIAASAKNGGISGDELTDSLLHRWDKNPALKGAAARIGASTISGRLAQFKEQSQYSLGKLFYDNKGPGGQLQYSGFGTAIMGTRNKKTGQYEGGLLGQLGDIGKNSLPTIQKLLKEFISGISIFVGALDKISKELKAHPEIAKIFLSIAKWAALLAPIMIGLGALAKISGGLLKLSRSASRTVTAPVRAARGASRTASQVRAGLASRRAGDGFRSGYRDRRTVNQTGSSPIAANAEVDRLAHQVQAADDNLKELRDRLKEVNRTSLADVIAQMTGSGHNSVAAAAQTAQSQVQQVQTQGIEPLNRSSLSAVQQEIDSTRTKVDALCLAVRDAVADLGKLDAAELTKLKLTLSTTHGVVDDLQNKINNTALSVGDLDKKTLDNVQAQVRDLGSTVDATSGKVGLGEGNHLAGRIHALNGISLGNIRQEFQVLTGDVNDAYKAVGATKLSGTLAGRIYNLNRLSLGSINTQVDNLTKALARAGDAAKALGDDLTKIGDNVNLPNSGGGSNDKGKKKKLSTGGILPGYSPGIDTIPAILSPGEAVLRPEVTKALGPDRINAWNHAAMSGKIQRFSGGGIAQHSGLDKIQTLLKLEDIWPLVPPTVSTMAMDASSDGIGGRTQDGILGTGSRTAVGLGNNIAGRFSGIYDFITDDMWKLLKKIPLPDGLSQAVGIVGGTLAPTLAEYFSDDVWHGSGNIIERGERFLADTFSVKTLTSSGSNLVGGIWDSIESILGAGKDVFTDPLGSAKAAISVLYDLGTANVDQIVGMVKATKSILDAPGKYAGNVINDEWSSAKAALPNTKGLFDFGNGDSVKGKKPDLDSIFSTQVPGGPAIMRWLPDVKRVLNELHLDAGYADLVLKRITVESGGNASAVNNWDSNAKAGHPSMGLMQTIQPTFDAYAGPYKPLGILNGLASIYAGLNYATHRYGAGWPAALSGTKGYWMGTRSASPGMALVGERGPELVNFGTGGAQVYDNKDTMQMLNRPSKNYEIHIHEAKSEDTTQATIRALKYMENLYGI